MRSLGFVLVHFRPWVPGTWQEGGRQAGDRREIGGRSAGDRRQRREVVWGVPGERRCVRPLAI